MAKTRAETNKVPGKSTLSVNNPDITTTVVFSEALGKTEAIAKKKPNRKAIVKRVKPKGTAVRPSSTSARKMPSPPIEETPLQKVLRKGPNGSPVLDELGFELSYSKVLKATTRPRRAVKSSAAYFDMLNKEITADKRKAEIMGTPWNQVSATSQMAWTDRIARDLGKEYHKVGMEDFEEWARRGFKAEEGEFEARNMTEDEKARILRLATGSAFRK